MWISHKSCAVVLSFPRYWDAARQVVGRCVCSRTVASSSSPMVSSWSSMPICPRTLRWLWCRNKRLSFQAWLAALSQTIGSSTAGRIRKLDELVDKLLAIHLLNNVLKSWRKFWKHLTEQSWG